MSLESRVKGLLPHQLDIPFLIRRMATIMFAVASQIPLLNDFPLTNWKKVVFTCNNHSRFYTTKFSMAYLLASFLRFTTTPSTGWCFLSTFTHNACNVMRGHILLMCHSVKHYETKDSFNSIISSMFEFNCKNKCKN